MAKSYDWMARLAKAWLFCGVLWMGCSTERAPAQRPADTTTGTGSTATTQTTNIDTQSTPEHSDSSAERPADTGETSADSYGDTGSMGSSETFDIVELEVTPCADPSRRATQRFDVVELGRVDVPEVFIYGGGLAVVDLDGDDVYEIVRTAATGFEIWEQRGSGWEERSLSTPLQERFAARVFSAVSAVDLDGDGDQDLSLAGFYNDHALLENRDGEWVDVSAVYGVHANDLPSQSMSWGDPDGDGDLDLFVASYGPWPLPDMLPFTGDPSRYYHRHPWGFEDESGRLPNQVQRAYGFMGAWVDLDGDGDDEMFSLHDFPAVSHSVLLGWSPAGFVVDEGSEYQTGYDAMGVALADVNGDGLVDLFQSGFSRASLLTGSAWAVADHGLTWFEQIFAWGLMPSFGMPSQRVYGWGVEVADLDNDGAQELLQTYGDWQGPEDDDYFKYTPDALWVQDMPGVWSEASNEWAFNDPRPGRSLLAADLNQDGWLDLVAAYLNGPTVVRYGVCGVGNFLEVQLRQDAPNTHAVGARVTAYAGDTMQTRWITSGSRSMYAGEPAEVHFGLGDIGRIDRLVIRWPDATELELTDITANRRLRIHRP